MTTVCGPPNASDTAMFLPTTTAPVPERASTRRLRAGAAGARDCPQYPPAEASAGIELRHLRYFVALADAGSFTHAAERMFITQPTLSQQIRRLEEIIGAPLLQRRREGLRLTKAGTVFLDASRNVLSLVDHAVSRTRQAAGLGRQRLRVVVPPHLPDALAVETASALRSAAAAADVDVVWMETLLDAEPGLRPPTEASSACLSWPAWTWCTARAEPAPAVTTPGCRCCVPSGRTSSSPIRHSGIRSPLLSPSPRPGTGLPRY